MNGFLNINKPAGLTSHDVVARVRRLTVTRRVPRPVTSSVPSGVVMRGSPS